MTVTEAPQALRETAAPDVLPVRVLEVELGEPLASISAYDPASGIRYRQALCLIRMHTQPLGLLRFDLAEETLSAEVYATHIWSALASDIQAHCRNDALPCPDVVTPAGLPNHGVPACIAERRRFLVDAPFVTVAVATRNRAVSLHRCLDALLAMDYPSDRYEIIVVDNAPSDGTTATLVQQMSATEPRLRYVREDRSGLSCARNRALSEARGKIIAMTDDDVRVDSHWLTELVRPFNLSPNAACVTGLIMPAELETPAQVWFESYAGAEKRFSRRLYTGARSAAETPLHPYTAGRFGAGASMAFTVEFLQRIGGFDPALGAGTAAWGGEDLAAFFQVIQSGHTLVYQPTALVYHYHRREYAVLRQHMQNHAVGLTAYLTKILFDKPWLLVDISRRVPYGLYYALSPHSQKNSRRSATYPSELMKQEIKGMLYGPWGYLRGRVSRRRNSHT